MSEKEVLSYAMAAEETSTHPLAGAIMRYGRELGASPKAHGDVVTEVSRGSRTIGGQKDRPRGQYRIHAGKRREGRRSPAR